MQLLRLSLIALLILFFCVVDFGHPTYVGLALPEHPPCQEMMEGQNPTNESKAKQNSDKIVVRYCQAKSRREKALKLSYQLGIKPAPLNGKRLEKENKWPLRPYVLMWSKIKQKRQSQIEDMQFNFNLGAVQMIELALCEAYRPAIKDVWRAHFIDQSVILLDDEAFFLTVLARKYNMSLKDADLHYDGHWYKVSSKQRVLILAVVNQGYEANPFNASHCFPNIK